jgi:hypothetical protein
MQAAAGGAKSLRHLAFRLDRETMIRLMDDQAIPVSAELPGGTDADRRRYYAESVTDLLRNAYPVSADSFVPRPLASRR